VREAIRLKHYSYKTEQTYVDWVYRFILFHGKRHPKDMGASEIEAFLTHLAVQRHVAASTQNQALCAFIFLYRHVLRQEIDLSINAVCAKRSRYLPTVLTQDEAIAVIGELLGVYQRVVKLLYGSGLRLSEALRLRVKDLDFAQRQIIVRDGKGGNSRITMLPDSVIDSLKVQELLSHKDVKTTTIYTHVLNKGGRGVRSPLDMCA
jgi:site-specific recombinase XerD